jgi:hypothetical protein
MLGIGIMNRCLALLSVAVVSLITSHAMGGMFMGETLEFSNYCPGAAVTAPTTSVVVGGGVEIPNWNSHGLSVDAYDSGLNVGTIKYFIDGWESGGFVSSPNLLMATAALGIPSFSSATIVGASDDWNDPSRLSFTNNGVSFDVGGLTFQPGDYVILNVSSVPEPSTLALWSLFGLIGCFVAWRKRKQ